MIVRRYLLLEVVGGVSGETGRNIVVIVRRRIEATLDIGKPRVRDNARAKADNGHFAVIVGILRGGEEGMFIFSDSEQFRIVVNARARGAKRATRRERRVGLKRRRGSRALAGRKRASKAIANDIEIVFRTHALVLLVG